MKKIIILFAIAVFLYFPISLFAETIVLKSGKIIEGKIIKQTDEYIKIDFQGTPLTYYFKDIESIDGNICISSEEFQKNVIAPMTELSEKGKGKDGNIDLNKLTKAMEDDRIFGNEETASATLRMLSTAFECYKFAENTYPKTLLELLNTTPPYIAMNFEEGSHMGYKYKVVNSTETFYLIIAYPDPNIPSESSGRYSFCVTEEGIVKVNTSKNEIKSCEACKNLPEYKINENERSVFMK